MHNSGALAIPAELDPLLMPNGVPADALKSLFQPLPFLLSGGGDVRLEVSPVTKMNVYGCQPAPRPHALAFSSSTATSISERAYLRALQARDELIEESISSGFVAAFDVQIERMRKSLTANLDLDGRGTEIVFSPSGTDSQLHALFLARELLGGPVSCVVVGADQTGSGTVHTSRGRHFSDWTAQGKRVDKGLPIEGQSEEAYSIGVSLFAPDGSIRSEYEIDAAVVEAVAEQIWMGNKVVLQAMDSSKLGWRAPSDACLKEITERWPSGVLIVVDACQMRIGRPRLREYINRGYVVLLTGSKFFTGPAFCGASLWPQALSARVAMMNTAPGGLGEYATRFDMPMHWTSLRDALPAAPNFGQWLRWEAALEEIRAYFALPESYRTDTLLRLAEATAKAISSSQHLVLLRERDASGSLFREDMPPTVFPFFVLRNNRLLEADEMTKLYHALNSDLAAALPRAASEDDRALASVICHVGQPVKLPAGTVLRIGIGARLMSEAWCTDGIIADANIGAAIAKIKTIVKKIDMLVATNAHLGKPQ